MVMGLGLQGATRPSACWSDFLFLVFLVKDACLFSLYLIYFCLVKLSLPVIGAGVII